MSKFIFLTNGLIKFLHLILILSLVFIPAKVNAIDDGDKFEVSKLQEKIAKGYSSKFCNAIGMGVSKESALRLTINENKEAVFNPMLWMELAVSGDKRINKIDSNTLASDVSSYVVDSCGYPLGLSGEEGIKEFTNLFTSIMKEINNT